MPTYFFHLIDEQSPVTDDCGAELAGDAAAIEHSLFCAREIIAQDVLAGKPVDLRSCISICDAEGRELRRICLRDVISFVET